MAKRFDRPFRLPASRSPDPASASLAPDTSSGRSASRDGDAGADGADATSVSGADELTTRLAGLVLIEDDDDCGEEETETQEAAARSKLIELLDAVPCADGATGGDDGSGGGGIAQAQQVRCDAASLRAFARDTLPPLVHLSHRRERHCRIMLQHPNADALAWRLHDLLVGASRSASLGQADDETPQLCASHYYDDAARELASLLVHNLSVAASSKEPRDEDRFKPRDDGEDDEEDEDREEAGDSAEDDDGAKAPSLSLVNHPTWEGIVRAIFDDVERLVDVREVAATGGMRSVRRERRERARLSSPTEYEEWSKTQIADGRMDSDDDDDDVNDDDTSVSPEDHDALCRGRLGTAVGAVLAAMEPDSARPKLLAMDGGLFFPRVFRTCSRILPSRHGDASLDAVGVMHRLLWIRPDATTAERETLMRTLVEMDDDDMDGSEETKEETKEEPNEMKDPLWTWTRERGYESCPPHKGDLDVLPVERVASDSNLRPHDSTSAQAERVSVNGVIAALRTHLPWPVGVAGDRLGAGGGSLACTQALHVLRAMFEDLGVIEAQRKYGRAGEGVKTEALWPQLRGDQLGDLVTQLAVVIEVLGQPAKTVQKKDKDKDKDEDEDEDCVGKKKDGKDDEGGTEVDGFWIPEENKPEEIPPSGLDVEINSQKPGGGWDTWRTVIPKEGECDGALGAAVGILNALCTHPVLFHVIDGHPRLHDVIRAVTRASASQCSCAWATFSCVVNLSTRAAKCDEETGDPVHVLGDALLTSPSAGHLLRGLANAVCDKWPIMSVDEMPPVQCLPPPDPPERAARRQRKETRRKEQETKRNKRPRRDTWKEKTPKEKAKERRREAKRLARKNREKAAAGQGDESAGDVVETDAAKSSKGTFDSSTTAVSALSSAPIDDSDDSDSDADATHPNDPLANPANRLLLRTTAAAALASLARVQRRWDEDDGGGDASILDPYDPSALDAIDVDFEDVDPDTGRRRWVSPRDLVEISGPQRRARADYGKRIPLRREWAEANAVEAAARRENDAPETTTVADSDESTHSDEEDEPEPFRLDPSAVAAAAWPANRGALPKGPLPGGVDPEGILATVPLLDDIFAALSKPDTEDVGVAVEAVETLAAHEDARELLIPFAPAVIPKLIRHIAGTARQMEEARANGGVVKQPPAESEKEKEKGEVTGDGFWIPGDDKGPKETFRRTKSKRRKKRRRRKKPPTTVANLCARNALLVHTLYSVAKEAENAEEGSAWHLLLESTDELLPSFLTLLRPVPVNDAKPWLNDMAPPSDDPSSTQSGVVRALRLSAGSTHSSAGHKDPNPSATREMIGELGRNALIVLAEMADPANSRFDPDKGMRWAKHIIAHRRDLITVLLDIMAVTGANDAVDAERRRLHEERTSKSTPSSAPGGTGTNGTGTNGTVTGLHGGELDPVSKETRGGSVHGNSLRDGLEGIPEDEESKPWDDESHSGRYATLADVNLTEHEHSGGFTLNGVGTNHEGTNQPAVFVFPERPSSVASGPPSLVESVGDDYDFSEERREREEIIGDGGPESVASEGGASVDGDAAASSMIEHASEQFALTPDCAHIAAAAVFGIISWDPCMDKLLSALETGETRRDGVAVLVSRVVALLADALPRRKDGSGEDGDVVDFDEGHEGGFRSAPGGVEAVGLIARLTGSDAGRRALLAHAPGVVGYLLPCLRADLGQTAAFAVRALCGIARSRHGMQLLLKHERAEQLMAALSGMLPDPAGIAVFFEGDAVDRRRRGDGAHGQVLSEVVIAIATLSQEKAWRWRLLDIESDQPQALPRCLESDSVSTSEADTLVGMYLRRPGREFSTVRLVASLIALLRDEHREVVFNTLYCINCLMGEPPQSWGRGRDPNREEDNVARRALIAAAALGHRIAKIGCADESVSSHASLESNLAHVLNSTGRVQTSAKAGKDPNRDTNSNSDDAPGSDAPNVEPPDPTSEPEGRHPDDGPAPDCRLNATLVVANIAGDVEGRRMILGSVVDGVSAELVDGLATMLTGRDADRAMLAAYSMGELARPLRLDGEDPAVYPREVGESPGDVTLVPLTEMSENSSVRVGIRAASADDSFLGAQTDAVDRAFDSMPNHPLRDQVRDMLKTSAANARCAAVDVLGGDGANLKRWVETGYARVEDEPFDATSDCDSPELAKRRTRRARDHAIGAVLRDLDLNVKRQWLLEMLRWELGQVNAGVPVPGLTGVTLTCEREFPLEDLCHHCCVSNVGTDAPSSTQPGTFLMPPRGGVLVKFKGERGAGAAVRREWMSIVAASACDRSNLLFSSNDGGVTLHPNGMSGEVTATHLEYFASLGRLAAVALYHGETLPLRLTSAFCSRLLGHEMRLEDLKSVDPTLYRNQVEYVQTHGVAGLDLTWSDTADPTGVFRPGKVLRLRHPREWSSDDGGEGPGHVDTDDTDDKKDENKEALEAVTDADSSVFLRALVHHRVLGAVRDQTSAFAAGFGAVVPPQLRARMRGILNGGDVSSLIAGAASIDLDDWRTHAAYQEAQLAFAFSTECFWCAMDEFTVDERIKVLQFATGLTSPPAGGFRNLVGYLGDAVPFTLGELAAPSRDEDGALPMAHACFNVLRLPRLVEGAFGVGVEGGSKEMARRLRIAIGVGVRGFDDF